MCTLVLAWQVYDDAPILVAANRDEEYGRPAKPPHVWERHPRLLAPRDEEAGGTWLGVNEYGVVVGITNRRTDLVGDRSRGLLVRDALERASADDALEFVEREVADQTYAGFNLMIADAREAVVLEWDGVLRTTGLEPGVHVVVNGGFEAEDEKARRVRQTLRGGPDSPAGWLDDAKAALRDHDLETCVHGDGYGTRSSSVISVDADGGVTYEFADGRPCETDYDYVKYHGSGDPWRPCLP